MTTPFWLARRAVAALMVGSTLGVPCASAQVAPEPSRPTGRVLVRPAGVAHHMSVGLSHQQSLERVRMAEQVIQGHQLDRLPLVDVRVVKVPNGHDESAYRRALESSGLFDVVEPDRVLFPAGNTPDDPRFDDQWQHEVMRSADAWVIETGSPDIVVAFVDTGVDLDHPDLIDNRLPGYNSTFSFRLPESQGGPIGDVNGHGSAIAGACSATGNNGTGGSGVGWDIPYIPVRTSNSGSGAATLSDILAGVDWAYANGADIISVSYAGVESPTVGLYGTALRDNNRLLVWAADNTNRNFDWFDHEDVIVVGATTQSDNKYSASSYGPAIDCMAPGAGVLLTNSSGGHNNHSGSSYAAPMVAGAAALIWSIAPDMSADQVEDILLATCADIGAPGEDDVFGFGRVDLFNAVLTTQLLYGNGSGTGGGPGSGTGGAEDDEFRTPDDVIRIGDGVLATGFDITGSALPPSLDGRAPTHRERLDAIDFPLAPGPISGTLADGYALRLDGLLLVPSAAEYTLRLQADDTAALYLGDELLIDHDPSRPFAQAAEATVGLLTGPHRFRIEYADESGDGGIRLTVASPALPEQPVGGALLGFEPVPTDLNADGITNLSDLQQFLNLWNQLDPAADYVPNGTVNLTDLQTYLNDWYGESLL